MKNLETLKKLVESHGFAFDIDLDWFSGLAVTDPDLVSEDFEISLFIVPWGRTELASGNARYEIRASLFIQMMNVFDPSETARCSVLIARLQALQADIERATLWIIKDPAGRVINV